MTSRTLLTLLVCFSLSIPTQRARSEGSARQTAYVPFESEKSTWHGEFARYDFVMDAETMAISPFKRPEKEGFGIGAPSMGTRRCVVVCPTQPAPGNPWSWRGCYWDHQPQTEVALLKRGFHIAYISADATLKPDKCWEAWYSYLTEKHGLSPKPAFVGMSRGGEYGFMWATNHPDKVSAIYADNPGGNDENLRKLLDLSHRDVPLMLVCGTVDPLMLRFATTIESAYHQYGGRISMILKDGVGHHPHSLNDPTPMADFIERSTKERPPAVPEYVGSNRFNHFSYYSLADTYAWSPKDGYYLTRRGPAFTECYDRYEVFMGLVNAVNIIAPRKEAPGRPWVFRATYVDRDANVDQALVAKGFHIVVGPVGYGDGPIHADWDKLYKYLTDHGFSKKPVMEGSGGAAGSVYTWAIENPDKVSCIYTENPLLHLNNLKTQPLDNLEPLAKAGVPLLCISGSLDPALEDHTRAAEKRYKAMNGNITVIIQEGVGHFPTAPKDPKDAIDFILKHQ